MSCECTTVLQLFIACFLALLCFFLAYKIRYVHHGIQYANVPPIYQMPDIPTVIPSSDVLMVS